MKKIKKQTLQKNKSFYRKKIKNRFNDNKIFEIANIFKLLGEPTRLKIIMALIEKELSVSDLSAIINSTVSAVSHQLRLLRSARLVKYRKQGKMIFYSTDDAHINNVILQIEKHTEE